MSRNSIQECPKCQTTHTTVLEKTAMLFCRKCHAVIVDNNTSQRKEESFALPPEDWSFTKLGSTGEVEGKPFKIVGRVRLQLRNDYKNFWCAEYDRGKCLWLVESFASFALFTSTWAKYTKKVEKLRAAAWIPINEKVNLRGEYLEKCEGISFEGEIGEWMFYDTGFFVVQSGNKDGATAIYFIKDKDDVQWLAGLKKTPETLKLSNIVNWDEWK